MIFIENVNFMMCGCRHKWVLCFHHLEELLILSRESQKHLAQRAPESQI